MLDPMYRGMQCIKEYIRFERTKVVMEDYDNKVFIPLLLKVFKFLDPR
jgi:hypothetical protein